MHIAKIRQGYLMFASAMATQLLIGCGSPEPAPLPSRLLAAAEDTTTGEAEAASKPIKKTNSVPVQTLEASSPNPDALAPTQLAMPEADTGAAGAGSLLGGSTGGNPIGGGSLLGGLGGIGVLGGIPNTASSLLSGVTGLLGGGGSLLGGLGGIGNLGALTGGLTGQPAANQ